MEVTTDTIDMDKCRAEGNEAPRHILRRNPNEEWFVMEVPGDAKRVPEFGHVVSGEYLSIPLFPYCLPDRPDMALATMLIMNLSMLGVITNPVAHAHVVTGLPIEELDPEESPPFTSRFWMGFAIKLSR